MNSRVKAAIKAVVPYRACSPLQDLFRYATSLRFVGRGYQCPFCGGRFSAFLPNGIDVTVLAEMQVIGGGYRTNSKCPRCRSEDRERLVFLFLEKTKSAVFTAPIALLHVAPEKSLSRKLKSFANIRYTSGDLNSPVADVQMDITDIKIESASFDLVICNHVLEHIPEDGRAMRELWRVTKSGGFAILQVPISPLLEQTKEDLSVTDPAERERLFGQRDHVRIYGQDYATRLESAGWAVTTHTPHDFLDASSVREFGLLENEKVFLCSKR
jgi:SAM-dependent methyltransferase